MMPLSEQEQKLLDEMERNLYKSETDFVATVGPSNRKPHYRSIVVGVLVALAGVVLLICGVVIQQPIVGVVAFAVMVAGVLIAIRTPKKHDDDAPRNEKVASDSPSSSSRPPRSGLVNRMNDRWERRQGE